MIDPHVTRAVKSDSITAPDVLGVELADSDVLDDNVGNATSKTQSLSEKNTALSIPNDGLVALDLNGVERSLVVADINARGIGLVVGALESVSNSSCHLQTDRRRAQSSLLMAT